ncbi:MAG: ExbD/TolR family protein [Opitutales bacterium]
MKKSLRKAEKSEEINMSPLIDMVFILLIFFIVTTVFIDERGFESAQPDDASETDSEEEPIILHVTKSRKVLLNGQEIGFAGVQREVRNRIQGEPEPVILQVDQGTVSADALRVYDEALLAGALAVTMQQAN